MPSKPVKSRSSYKSFRQHFALIEAHVNDVHRERTVLRGVFSRLLTRIDKTIAAREARLATENRVDIRGPLVGAIQELKSLRKWLKTLQARGYHRSPNGTRKDKIQEEQERYETPYSSSRSRPASHRQVSRREASPVPGPSRTLVR